MAATIPQGMRATAVKVDDVVNVSGFVTPGMRVDVLITGQPPNQKPGDQDVVSRTILQDIQVPIGGVVITNRMNINVHGKNSLQFRLPAPAEVRKGAKLRFRQRIELSIAAGEYTFAVGLAATSHDVYARVEAISSSHPRSKPFCGLGKPDSFPFNSGSTDRASPFTATPI